MSDIADRETWQIGYEAGFSEGLEQGRADLDRLFREIGRAYHDRYAPEVSSAEAPLEILFAAGCHTALHYLEQSTRAEAPNAAEVIMPAMMASAMFLAICEGCEGVTLAEVLEDIDALQKKSAADREAAQ